MELILGITGSYTFASCLRTYYKYYVLQDYSEIDTVKLAKIWCSVEGVKLNYFEKTVDMPVHINIGNNSRVGIPIGGGKISQEEEYLYSKFQKSPSSISMGDNCTCTDDHVAVHYVNKMQQLDKIFNKYHIQNNKILVKLPLVAYHYDLKKPVYQIINVKHNVIGTNQNAVITRYLMKTRLPLSFTIATLFVAGIGYTVL